MSQPPNGIASEATERCGICQEELFDHEKAYCEDCRDSGDLESVLDAALNPRSLP